MLSQLLDKLNTRINNMNIAVEAPKFAAQMRKMRPSLESELKTQGIAQDQIEPTIQVLGPLGIAAYLVQPQTLMAPASRLASCPYSRPYCLANWLRLHRFVKPWKRHYGVTGDLACGQL